MTLSPSLTCEQLSTRIVSIVGRLQSLLLKCFVSLESSSTRTVGVECGMPRNPNHGTIIPRFRGTPQYGDAVSYSCLRGYGLVGSSDRTCQADSSWSGNTPSCMSEC